MEYKIAKGTTQFRYGMTDVNQLIEWLNAEKPIGVSFIGRSNAGKSSTINSLFGKSTAVTSKTPGRTRQVNIFSFQLEKEGKIVDNIPPFYLFDLPGYGHAKVSKEIHAHWANLMDEFFRNCGEQNLMLNLQDARHPNQKADLVFRDYLSPFGHEAFLLFNKLDKLKTQKDRAALNKLKPAIFKEHKWVTQIHFISALKGQGVPQLENAIINYLLLQYELANTQRD
ncbi:ribosome biogenesis GTP-binding protein YihA/YsxC [Halobacteriovorax sp. ZH5_bin.2]|uniref:ribosome biogenesis GTP-binding protein YihA/YsxC n=1 Tax=unclassified Halobacteriovorax TaxID=2639665 RepID=UPI003723A34B